MEYVEGEKHANACLVKTPPATGANESNVIRQKPGDFWGEEVEKVVERRAKEVARHREWVM